MITVAMIGYQASNFVARELLTQHESQYFSSSISIHSSHSKIHSSTSQYEQGFNSF